MSGEGTVRDLTATGPLILVNAAHPLRTPTNPELVALEGGVLLERRAAAALRACLRAVGGTAGILPVSGWRSRAEQQAIWDDTLAKEGLAFTQSYVAMPDCSEHQTGLAIDLGRRQENVDFIRPYFPDEGVCRAFRLAAPRYGFVLRYPAGRENVTGIAHEPWHFRYVGPIHGEIMARLDLTLEEYLGEVRKYPAGGAPFRFSTAEWECALTYLPGGVGEPFRLAGQQGLLCSGDNCGGVVAASWRSTGG